MQHGLACTIPSSTVAQMLIEADAETMKPFLQIQSCIASVFLAMMACTPPPAIRNKSLEGSFIQHAPYEYKHALCLP
jgi:hypothetical protein